MTRILSSSEKLNALLIHPVLAARLPGVQSFPFFGFSRMNDDLIDETGFDMSLPSPLEMTRQECLLLHNELRDVWAELRRSRRNVAGLCK